MKKLLAVLLLTTGFMACHDHDKEQHSHLPDGSHPEEKELQSLSYTVYSGKSELFVEFKPLIAGQSSSFAAHLTITGESFLPYTEGTVTLRLIQGDKSLQQVADSPSSPGIFRLKLQPVSAGKGKLVFDIVTKSFTDQFILEDIPVWPDEKSALAAQPAETASNDITYLKEQAWKTEFANIPVKRDSLYDVIKTTGELLPAPGEEVTIASRSNGIVRFRLPGLVTGVPVRSGQPLISVTGGTIAFENIEAAKQAAQAELASAGKEYDRLNQLIGDKLVTRNEYENARLRLEQAKIRAEGLSRNYNSAKNLVSPLSGFIRSVLVTEGQYVAEGQPLAVVSQHKNILLRADLSLKDAARLHEIREAHFKIPQSPVVFSTQALAGKRIAATGTTGSSSPFIPVHFQLNGTPELIPGTFAEVYLKTGLLPDALTIPLSALLEEQGLYYAYVQTAGESFQKREIKTGVSDGINVQVLSGLQEGERVVVKGAYQIKLSQASGSLPAHGHEH